MVDISFNQLNTALFTENTALEISYRATNNNISSVSFSHLFPYDVLNLANQYPNSATQGLTSLTLPGGIFDIYRPRELDVSNNLLTSIDLGSGIETATEILKLNNNKLGPSFTLPLPVDEFTGYRLFRLDLSGNNLQTIDVRYGAPLLELDVSDNPLTSLLLPANVSKTYPSNSSYVNDPESQEGYGDPITGEWWQFYATYGYNLPMLFQHLTGVQKLYARNTLLTSFPTEGTKSIRVLDLRDNPALQSISSSAVFATYIGNNQWIDVRKGGIGFEALNIDGYDQAALTQSLKQNVVVVFRNLAFNGGAVSGGRYPVSGRPYIIHKAKRDTATSSSSSWSIIDRVSDITKWEPTGGDAELTFDGNLLSINGQPFAGDGLTGGQMAIYPQTQWTHLSEVYLDNCPLLTSADFRGSPLLSKFSSDSGLAGVLFNARPIPPNGWWRGYSGHVSSIKVHNAGAVTLAIAPVRDDNSGVSVLDAVNIENVGSLSNDVFYDFFATQFPAGVICRSGIQIKNVGSVSVTVLAGVLRTLGTWAFTSSLPGDSNVVDFSGTVATAGDSTTYNNSKTQAISRGWQVIDPTFV